MRAFGDALAPAFEGLAEDVTEENLQARIRGTLLMAQSNKFGWILLSTGNKSEISVGYCTLYGDTAGGFAAIKDVWKTTVFALSRWRAGLIPDQQGREVAVRICARPPSAELREDQRDTDALPPYEELDPILRLYVEQARSAAEIVALGHERETVARVCALVDRSEFKRRQSPLGVRVTPLAFGRDRRMPIINHLREAERRL